MGIETTEKYLQELESIKNYPRLKHEREELLDRVEELQSRLDNALREITSLKGVKANLDGANMTVGEARADFIRAQDAEVERRSSDRFEKLKRDYQAQIPDLAYRTLCNIMAQPRASWPEGIARLVDGEATKKADAILREQNRWPLWFKNAYEEEVKRKVESRLDQQFNARVEMAATARARQELNKLTKTAWPAWYVANVEPRIAGLETRIRDNVIDVLKQKRKVTCDKCGSGFEAELNAAGIEELLRTGQVTSECGNPDCQDKGLFSSRRHVLRVTLHDLISAS